ncbi:MAG: hypothetical protein AB1551_02905 [Actinomycetota bacterium]
MRRYLPVLLVLGLVVGLAGSCSDEDGDSESEGWQPCEPSSEAVLYPKGPKNVVLRVGQRGGFPPPAYMPDPLPVLTLYGDGRMIGIDESTADQLVPGLAERQLTERELNKLLHGAEVACLLEFDSTLELPETYDVPGVAFEVNTGSTTHLTYAVGLGWSEMDPNVPDDQREQRAALIGFMDDALALLEGATPIPTDRLGVFLSRDDAPPTPSDWPQVGWPLDRPLADFGQASPEAYPEVHCAIATGKDAKALLAVLEGLPPDQAPYWLEGRSWYHVELRPMLPDEGDCAALVA